MDIVDLAKEIEASLVLAIAFEPPELLAERVFGLDDVALRWVVALTLARIQVTRAIEISLLLTTDDELHELNRNFRGRDESTDVLSFPLLDEPIVNAPEDQLWQPAEDDRQQDEDMGDAPQLLNLLADDPEDDAAPAYEGYDDAGDDAGDVASGSPFLLGEEFPLHLGDIAISLDAVSRQARQAGHSPGWELAYLLSHGVLHLAGYDDHSEAGYQAMVSHQEAVLRSAGIER